MNRDPGPIAILAALGEELSPIEKALTGRRLIREGGGAYLAGTLAGHPVAVARTGIGARSARRVADWLARTASPSLLIAVGFCGGLREGLAAGDLVLAEEIYEPPAPEGEGPREWQVEQDLLGAVLAAVPAGLRVERGRIVTARTILTSSAEKRSFGDRHGALAVDMESSGVARAANVHDLKAIYARAVVDDLAYDWPLDFGPLLTPEGRLRPLKALAAILRRPSALKALPDLRGRARLAASSLERFAIAAVGTLAPP
jgi:adenosylhomocysteine nucleosidase